MCARIFQHQNAQHKHTSLHSYWSVRERTVSGRGARVTQRKGRRQREWKKLCKWKRQIEKMWPDWPAYLKGGSAKMCKNTWLKSVMCLFPSLSLIFPFLTSEKVNQSMSLSFCLFFYISCNFPQSRGCVHWTKGLCVLKRRINVSFFFPHSLQQKVVYKNNDVRLELSRLAKLGDPKMTVCTFLQHVQLVRQHSISLYSQNTSRQAWHLSSCRISIKMVLICPRSMFWMLRLHYINSSG